MVAAAWRNTWSGANCFWRGALTSMQGRRRADSTYGGCLWGPFGVARLFLDKGADVNAQQKEGGTALWNASRKGYAEIVKLLLDKGADVKAKVETGATPLWWPVEQGKVEIVKLFLDKGADANEKGKSWLGRYSCGLPSKDISKE